MNYTIYLRRKDGLYKVSVLEIDANEASRQLSLYLFRNYPVSFFDEQIDGTGDYEKVLKDCRTSEIVWRQGQFKCCLEEGEFYIEQEKESAENIRWWESALPASKKTSIEQDIQNAWTKGFGEGYKKGMDEALALAMIGELY